MRAAHMKMAKETTAEQAANAANLTAIKNFFKGLFGHCAFSLSRNHPVVA
jgi:ribosomal protein L10